MLLLFGCWQNAVRLDLINNTLVTTDRYLDNFSIAKPDDSMLRHSNISVMFDVESTLLVLLAFPILLANHQLHCSQASLYQSHLEKERSFKKTCSWSCYKLLIEIKEIDPKE